MSKTGRKRIEGARYESGDLKPQNRHETGFAPTAIKRIVQQAARAAVDPLLGSAVGQMFLEKKITARQLATASRYARLRGRFDRATGVPGRITLSPDYGAARGISAVEPLSDRAVKRIKREHAEMLAALPGWPYGTVSINGEAPLSRARRLVALLDRVLVDDLSCAAFELPALRAALDVLAVHFGVEE